MAELKCGDGTIVQISKETEAELRRAFGEPEPTFKVGDIFWRDYNALGINTGSYFRLKTDGDRVGLAFTTTGRYVNGSIRVKDINAITFAEVCSMTLLPQGLRLIKTFTVTEK